MNTSWSEIPLEKLCPRLLLASFFIYPKPFAPEVYIPGINMYLVVEGKMRYHCSDGTTGIAGKDHLLTFYSGINRYEVISKSPMSIYQVVFYPAHPPFEQGTLFCPDFGVLPHCLNVAEEIDNFIEIFSQAIDELLRLSPTWEIETSSTVLQLINLALSVHGQKKTPSPKRLDEWERLLARLGTDNEMPKINELADEFNMTPQHFIRKFTQYTGKTPKQFLLEQRLFKGRMMIIQGSPIKEAAYQCGFNDPLYFSKLFKKKFGYSPSSAGNHSESAVFNPNSPCLPVSRHVLAPNVSIHLFSVKNA